MTAATDRISEFTTVLSRRARHLIDPLAHARLLTALDRGWPPAVMARSCTRDLPGNDRAARALILARLTWYADRDPASAAPAASGRHNCAGHPDGHVCPWVNMPDGSVKRCDCTTPGGLY